MKLLIWLTKWGAAGWVAKLIASRIRVIWEPSLGERQEYSLLGLSKGGFNDDFEAAFGNHSNFKISLIQRTDLQAVFRALIPDSIRDYTYRSDLPKIETDKKAYRKFLERIWEEMVRCGYRYDMVLSGNHVYYAERELAGMLENRGIPFVVVHKEALKTKPLAKFFEDKYRHGIGQFQGRRILVYNRIEQGILINSGVARPDQIRIVGMPRLDRYHDWRKSQDRNKVVKAEKHNVLFFMFEPDVGIFYEELGRKYGRENAGWHLLLREVTKTLVSIIKLHPDHGFTIKTKGMANGLERIKRDIFGGKEIPANVEVVIGGDPFVNVTNASAVIGFHSTAILEAVAAGKRVIVPRFCEAKDPKLATFLFPFGDAVEYAGSAKDLMQKLNDLLVQPALETSNWNPSREAVLEEWCGNSDGKACERLHQALRMELAACLRVES